MTPGSRSTVWAEDKGAIPKQSEQASHPGQHPASIQVPEHCALSGSTRHYTVSKTRKACGGLFPALLVSFQCPRRRRVCALTAHGPGIVGVLCGGGIGISIRLWSSGPLRVAQTHHLSPRTRILEPGVLSLRCWVHAILMFKTDDREYQASGTNVNCARGPCAPGPRN